jgi:hypothetical protein
MKALDPSIARALGWTGLMLYLTGSTFDQIAAKMGKNRDTVRKYIYQAADKMVDAAQEEVMETLFPLAVKLYAAQMQQQIERATQNKEPAYIPVLDMSIAERIMKGMFVLDRPQLKQQLADGELDPSEEETTLTALLLRKQVKAAPTPKQLPPAPSEVVDEGTIVEGKLIKNDARSDKA